MQKVDRAQREPQWNVNASPKELDGRNSFENSARIEPCHPLNLPDLKPVFCQEQSETFRTEKVEVRRGTNVGFSPLEDHPENAPALRKSDSAYATGNYQAGGAGRPARD